MIYEFEVLLPSGRIIVVEIMAASEDCALEQLQAYLEERYGIEYP